jgi:hypothetical protein
MACFFAHATPFFGGNPPYLPDFVPFHSGEQIPIVVAAYSTLASVAVVKFGGAGGGQMHSNQGLSPRHLTCSFFLHLGHFFLEAEL